MNDDSLGIISVLAFTAFLFLLRHLIVTVGKRKRKPSLVSFSQAAKKRRRQGGQSREKEPNKSKAKRAWKTAIHAPQEYSHHEVQTD
jgi:hypothetical protein